MNSFETTGATGGLLGSLRFWPVSIAEQARAILLGPLTVEPALQGAGIGRALVRHGLTEAKRLGAAGGAGHGAPPSLTLPL